MATDLVPEEVIIGTANGPGAWIAPASTAAPATIDTEPSGAWSPLGYLSEDGVTFAANTDSEDIKPWQSKSPVRTVITGRTLTAECALMQVNAQNMALYFGQDVPTEVDGEFKLTVRSDAPAHTYALLIDVLDETTLVRYYFPRVTLSEAGDIEVTAGGSMNLPVTLTALDDAGVLCEVEVGTVAGS